MTTTRDEQEREGTAGREAPSAEVAQSARLQLALADNLDTLCRLVWYVADEDAGDDEIIACLSALAHDASEIVPPGRERAWLLRTLLGLLGAAGDGETEPQRDLPKLARAATPLEAEIPDAAFLRVHEALRAVEKPERASVVLVVQEGLSVSEGVRIQGGSRIDFQRRLAEGMAALDGDLVDALMGRVGPGARS